MRAAIRVAKPPRFVLIAGAGAGAGGGAGATSLSPKSSSYPAGTGGRFAGMGGGGAALACTGGARATGGLTARTPAPWGGRALKWPIVAARPLADVAARPPAGCSGLPEAALPALVVVAWGHDPCAEPGRLTLVPSPCVRAVTGGEVSDDGVAAAGTVLPEATGTPPAGLPVVVVAGVAVLGRGGDGAAASAA